WFGLSSDTTRLLYRAPRTWNASRPWSWSRVLPPLESARRGKSAQIQPAILGSAGACARARRSAPVRKLHAFACGTDGEHPGRAGSRSQVVHSTDARVRIVARAALPLVEPAASARCQPRH